MKSLRAGLVYAGLVLLCAALAYGQAVSGSLLGTVTDASGATVPGAKVTITEVNTGISRAMETNQSGFFSFPSLEPGSYRVSVERAGFRTGIREGVDVLVNTTVRADVTLQPGAVSESIIGYAAKFFAKFRDLTAGGFYTTPVCMKDIGYVGNTPLAKFDGPPLEALRKAGLA